MSVLVDILDKEGGVIKIINYRKSFENQVMELFREGYPDSFDGHDLRAIKKTFNQKPEKTFLLAFCGEELVGCSTGCFKREGPQDVYVGGYLYVKESFRHRGIARMIFGAREEILKNKARLIVAINAGILQEEDRSIGWFESIGFIVIGEVRGWFRDDLSGVYLGKRNPFYPIGKGIPKNSGWCPGLVESLTGRNITEEEYQKALYNPGLTPEKMWGFGLIGCHNIIYSSII